MTPSAKISDLLLKEHERIFGNGIHSEGDVHNQKWKKLLKKHDLLRDDGMAKSSVYGFLQFGKFRRAAKKAGIRLLVPSYTQYLECKRLGITAKRYEQLVIENADIEPFDSPGALREAIEKEKQ